MAFDLATFKRNRLTYETTASAQRIQLDCKQIARFDQQMEKRKILAIALCTAGGLLLFFSFLAAAVSPIPLRISLAILAVGIVLLIQAKGAEIPDLRHQLLLRIIEVLGRDMDEKATYHVRLNCTPSTDKSKKVETVPHPYRRKWKIDRFRDNWLDLSGKFIDGTDLNLSISELNVSKYGWKQSRSGKSKFKRKNKCKGLEIALKLTFSRKRYGAIQLLQKEIRSAIRLPSGVRLKGIKANDHMLMLTIKAPQQYLQIELLPNLITQLLLSAFHVLTLAKQLSKPTGQMA